MIEPDAFLPMETNAMTQLHEEERLMINELTIMLDKDPVELESIDQKLDALLAHTMRHFQRENENMALIEFPPLPVHQEEHDLALEKMRSHILIWKSDRNVKMLASYLQTELPQWLAQHIATMDKITARFFSIYEQKTGVTLNFDA